MYKIAKDDLSGSLHKEKEKRIDLKSLPLECKDIKPIEIKQGILKEVKSNDKVIAYARVRSKKDPGSKPKYSLGIKNFSKNEEAEAEISKETFDVFYPKNVEKPQVKDRYKMSNGWTVDKKQDGSIVAEYEYNKKDNIAAVPKDWDIKKEAAFNFSILPRTRSLLQNSFAHAPENVTNEWTGFKNGIKSFGSSLGKNISSIGGNVSSIGSSLKYHANSIQDAVKNKQSIIPHVKNLVKDPNILNTVGNAGNLGAKMFADNFAGTNMMSAEYAGALSKRASLILEQIKRNAFLNELQKIAVEVYDPKLGHPPKKPHHEDVSIPVVHNHDDAGEQGGSIMSE
jgi:hypothetical protein